jgi:hypothetical protein
MRILLGRVHQYLHRLNALPKSGSGNLWRFVATTALASTGEGKPVRNPLAANSKKLKPRDPASGAPAGRAEPPGRKTVHLLRYQRKQLRSALLRFVQIQESWIEQTAGIEIAHREKKILLQVGMIALHLPEQVMWIPSGLPTYTGAANTKASAREQSIRP